MLFARLLRPFMVAMLISLVSGFRPLAATHRQSSQTQTYYSRRPEEEAKTGFQSVAQATEDRLDALYERSFKIKCPFFRRRAFDAVEGLKSVFYFLIVRHKSTPFFPMPTSPGHAAPKLSLPLDRLASILHGDWMGRGLICDGKGYYVTGRMSKQVYSEDCFFDGPDPDMPVRGLRKYLLSASQLFDKHQSRADLSRPLEIDWEAGAHGTVTAYWRLEGVLNLPWHPHFKPWTGHTVYSVDETGLIVSHCESWDISVVDAFVSTLLPNLSIGAPPAPPVALGQVGDPISR
jgi:hypothetical protein